MEIGQRPLPGLAPAIKGPDNSPKDYANPTAETNKTKKMMITLESNPNLVLVYSSNLSYLRPAPHSRRNYTLFCLALTDFLMPPLETDLHYIVHDM